MTDKRRYRTLPFAKLAKFIRKLTLANYRLNWRLHQKDSCAPNVGMAQHIVMARSASFRKMGDDRVTKDSMAHRQ
jgi:hypothetical protein